MAEIGVQPCPRYCIGPKHVVVVNSCNIITNIVVFDCKC